MATYQGGPGTFMEGNTVFCGHLWVYFSASGIQAFMSVNGDDQMIAPLLDSALRKMDAWHLAVMTCQTLLFWHVSQYRFFGSLYFLNLFLAML